MRATSRAGAVPLATIGKVFNWCHFLQLLVQSSLTSSLVLLNLKVNILLLTKLWKMQSLVGGSCKEVVEVHTCIF